MVPSTARGRSSAAKCPPEILEILGANFRRPLPRYRVNGALNFNHLAGPAPATPRRSRQCLQRAPAVPAPPVMMPTSLVRPMSHFSGGHIQQFGDLRACLVAIRFLHPTFCNALSFEDVANAFCACDPPVNIREQVAAIANATPRGRLARGWRWGIARHVCAYPMFTPRAFDRV